MTKWVSLVTDLPYEEGCVFEDARPFVTRSGNGFVYRPLRPTEPQMACPRCGRWFADANGKAADCWVHRHLGRPECPTLKLGHAKASGIVVTQAHLLDGP